MCGKPRLTKFTTPGSHTPSNPNRLQQNVVFSWNKLRSPISHVGMNILAFGFGNLGGPDLFVILLIVLILFGSKKLPDLARSLGQSMNEFRKAREDFDRELRDSGTQRPQAQPPQPAQQDAPASGVQEVTLGRPPQSVRTGK